MLDHFRLLLSLCLVLGFCNFRSLLVFDFFGVGGGLMGLGFSFSFGDVLSFHLFGSYIMVSMKEVLYCAFDTYLLDVLGLRHQPLRRALPPFA
jgi:hypothetical protein